MIENETAYKNYWHSDFVPFIRGTFSYWINYLPEKENSLNLLPLPF